LIYLSSKSETKKSILSMNIKKEPILDHSKLTHIYSEYFD